MNSEMMLYIKSAFAQSEATSASKRMSTSIRMKMEDGTYVATSAPFGYRLVDGEYITILFRFTISARTATITDFIKNAVCII